MAQEGSDINFVTKLIAASKTLTNANILKCEYEKILKQLTLFKNFTSMFDKPSSGVQNILTISAKLIRDSCVEQAGENILVSITNNSSVMDFSPGFWQFSIEYYDGVVKRVTCWDLEEALAKGKSQNFVTKFIPTVDFRPIQINLIAIFTLVWKEERFIRVLPIGSLVIDVMYYLNPGRLLGYNYSSLPISSISDLCRRLEGQERHFATISMFEFQFDSQLTGFFIKEVFLRDSVHRGFPPNFICLDDEKCSPVKSDTAENIPLVETANMDFDVYVQSEKIAITCSRNGGAVIFKCSNSKLLFSLKAAVFQRLLTCDGIKVLCPDDKICEKLYAIQSKLESKLTTEVPTNIPTEDSDSDSVDSCEESDSELMELYLELKDVSESVKFIKLSSVE